ncbi:MAG: T9SS type A sorting domain-containing protein [Bacteroidia bacterium]
MKHIISSTLLVVIILVNALNINAQIISNVAGNNVAGYSGDGNLATSAKINHPNGVAVDAMGNIYFSDYSNHVIRKVNTSGIISTFAGNTVAGYSGDGSLATSAKLNYPTGVAVDANGNVYIADKNNSVIRKVNTFGIITTIAGTSVTGYSGDGGLATSAKIYFPAAVATDAAGNVYISDTYNHAIRKVNTSGIISTVAGGNGIGYSGDGGVATSAEFNFPWGLTVDNAGNIFIGDEHNHVIRKVNTSGIISTVAGTGASGYAGDGGLATSAQLNVCNGVVSDALGNLYISDTYNNVIRKVSSSGIITTIAGTGVAGYSGNGGAALSAQLDTPSSITLDTAGNVLFTDGDNHVVRKITLGCGLAFTTHPINQTVSKGDNVNFSSLANNLSALYHWQYYSNGSYVNFSDNGCTIFGSSTNSISLNYVQNSSDQLQVRCIANYNGCADTSNVAILSVNSGLCTVYDTVHITVYDTIINYVAVTDTLIINFSLTGLNPPNDYNVIKIFPNPTSDHITIDYGTFSLMSGYSVEVKNTMGQTVFAALVNQQQSYIDISNWGGDGVYFVHILDSQNTILEIKKIILQ